MTIIWTSPIYTKVKNAMDETAKVYKWRDKSVIQFPADKVYFTDSFEAAKHLHNNVEVTDLRSVHNAMQYVISETSPIVYKTAIPKKYRHFLIDD